MNGLWEFNFHTILWEFHFHIMTWEFHSHAIAWELQCMGMEKLSILEVCCGNYAAPIDLQLHLAYMRTFPQQQIFFAEEFISPL